jgi:uncharacterized membrane protein
MAMHDDPFYPMRTMNILHHLRARPRLISAMLVGLLVSLLLPGAYSPVTRGLLGWNVAVWLYLALVGLMMLRADHLMLRRIAAAQAEGAVTVLAVVVLTALVSLAGIVIELSAAKVPGAPHAAPHVLFALVTVAGAWLIVPTLFALTYASEYYRFEDVRSLQFPDGDSSFKPHYVDFLYFSFTIAVASQTADISISTSRMRRLVLTQSVFSFAFNTAILAFTINIAASMF